MVNMFFFREIKMFKGFAPVANQRNFSNEGAIQFSEEVGDVTYSIPYTNQKFAILSEDFAFMNAHYVGRHSLVRPVAPSFTEDSNRAIITEPDGNLIRFPDNVWLNSIGCNMATRH